MKESWANINAMDDLVDEILHTSQIVVSALAGNAGAGGVALALAADEVWARKGVVLNQHYKGMELFGSEYWTYLFPKRVGEREALQLTETCLPISARRAKAVGLIDEVEELARIRRDFSSPRHQRARSAFVFKQPARALHPSRGNRPRDPARQSPRDQRSRPRARKCFEHCPAHEMPRDDDRGVDRCSATESLSKRIAKGLARARDTVSGSG